MALAIFAPHESDNMAMADVGRLRAVSQSSFAILTIVCLVACGGTTPGAETSEGGAPVTFTITSTAFAEGAAIPAKYTCDDANVSPPLRWDGAPAAQSFALIADDPDAPGGTFTHWVLFDIPAAQRELPEGLAAGALGVAGRNDFGNVGYGGPCPPRGAPHRYLFTLSALDVATLKLPANASRSEVEAAIRGHILGQAKLMGRYGRK
jgi:Raf kinase inhibitor-like YbhB/YbcL family protein